MSNNKKRCALHCPLLRGLLLVCDGGQTQHTFEKPKRDAKFGKFLESKNILIASWYMRTRGLAFTATALQCFDENSALHSPCQTFSLRPQKFTDIAPNSVPKSLLDNVSQNQEVSDPRHLPIGGVL